MSDRMRNLLTLLLLVVLAISAFFAGYYIRDILSSQDASAYAQEDFEVFWEAWGRTFPPGFRSYIDGKLE